MRIAFLLGFPEISGGTNVIMEYASRLSDRGHDVYVVTELPFDPKRLAWHPGSHKVTCASHADVRDQLFDLSIATWWRSVFDLPYVPSKKRVYFCQSIETRFFNHNDLDMKALVDLTYRLPIPVITEATWVSDYLLEVYGQKARVVKNGIRKDLFNESIPPVRERDERQVRILVEGPLGVPFKRVEETISLCKEAGVPEIWLLTSSELDEYPGVDRVFSKIPMKDVAPIYRSCDVLLKLSTVEGMFGPPLEMMHCGGTAITTDVTGFDEYLINDYNGVVVSIGDGSSVIRALRSLCDDRERLSLLKEGARRTALEWPSWEQSVVEFESALKDVLEEEVDPHQNIDDMLKASLKLAGPLHNVVHRTYGVKASVGILKRSLRTALKRRVPHHFSKLLRSKKGSVLKAKRITAEPIQETFIPSEFVIVGQAARLEHINLTSQDGVNPKFIQESTFVNLVGGGRNNVDSDEPLVIFEPTIQVWQSISRQLSRAIVIESRKVTTELATLYSQFGQQPGVSVLHTTDAQAAKLRALTGRLVGTCILGITPPKEIPSPWSLRKIDLLLIGSGHDETEHISSLIPEKYRVVCVSINNRFMVPSTLLGATKRVLYLPSGIDRLGGFLASHMIGAMAHGCLVISRTMGGGETYNLMVDEHYLGYDNFAQLGEVLPQCMEFEYGDQVIRAGELLSRHYAKRNLIQALDVAQIGGVR